MKQNKLNTFTLSGLIIGPILGSGVILLPPLLYNAIGNFSIFIWLGILSLGFIFAIIFGKLANLFPGEAGVSTATKEALGKKYQLLTSFYLICAVFFGPVAVLLIAGEFIKDFFPTISLSFLALCIYIITYILLLIRIDFLGKLMLIVSSLITIIFLLSSIIILFNVDEYIFHIPNIKFSQIGKSFLLVFWAIVGWEVIGNYSNDVKDKKTLTNAVIFSVIIISLVYVLISLSIIFGNFDHKSDETFKLVWLIQPLFGTYSNIILTVISLILCIGTLILFVGGVARLIASLKLTKYTSKHLSTGIPIGALNFLSFIYMITLGLVYFDILNLEHLVSFADGFFIANAIIGLVTAIALFENGFLRYGAILLTILFFTILLFSNIFILIVILLLFIYTLLQR